MISIGIIGATGYTGGELLRILGNHPVAKVELATSERSAGQTAGAHYPGLHKYRDLLFTATPQTDWPELDLYFVCVPHGKALEIVPRLLATHARVVDLSADFRLRSVATFEKWYSHTHTAPEWCANAIYGLSEIYRNQIREARLVANPGCYPTSILLPLLPLLQAKLPLNSPLIIDSKSGVSGAGRNPGLKGQYVEANENFSAYKIGRSHRHLSEIEEQLNLSATAPVSVLFTPHLLPVNRGILSTIYLSFTEPVPAEKLRQILNEKYASEPFIHILPAGETPQLVQVRYSNRCDIGLQCFENYAVIVSCIDNLLKGASGQAVQNMNIMFDLPEKVGLSAEGATS
jgi:N-acetyl-gamma-glutamyl-phosphate reductase